jgi:hypothetical protein
MKYSNTTRLRSSHQMIVAIMITLFTLLAQLSHATAASEFNTSKLSSNEANINEISNSTVLKKHVAQLNISLVLSQQQGEYHPPYVAAWLENSDKKSVRTLLLWRKEPKWLKDIRRWWRNVGRKDANLVDAITSATHAAGTFPLSFQATNDIGEPLPDGNYTLYIEVVREKGGRALLKQHFTLNNNAQTFTFKATAETGEIIFSITP